MYISVFYFSNSCLVHQVVPQQPFKTSSCTLSYQNYYAPNLTLSAPVTSCPRNMCCRLGRMLSEQRAKDQRVNRSLTSSASSGCLTEQNGWPQSVDARAVLWWVVSDFVPSNAYCCYCLKSLTVTSHITASETQKYETGYKVNARWLDAQGSRTQPTYFLFGSVLGGSTIWKNFRRWLTLCCCCVLLATEAVALLWMDCVYQSLGSGHFAITLTNKM